MFHMSKSAVPHMKPGSAIVNSGSVTGLMGNKDLLDYSTTKGGIHAFTRSLATKLIPKGIRVNAVAPGPVWTPLNPADKSAEDVSKFWRGHADEATGPSRKKSRSAFVFLASTALLQLHHRAKCCRSSAASFRRMSRLPIRVHLREAVEEFGGLRAATSPSRARSAVCVHRVGIGEDATETP